MNCPVCGTSLDPDSSSCGSCFADFPKGLRFELTNRRLMEELTAIPGIGPSKARSLMEAGFDSIEKFQVSSIEDLAAAKGIGEAHAENIKKHLEEKSASLYLCPSCGAFVSTDATECENCGAFMGGVEEEADEIEEELAQEIFGEEAEPAPKPTGSGASLYLCPECGAFISSDATECPQCGVDLGEEEEVVEEGTDEFDELAEEFDTLYEEDEDEAPVVISENVLKAFMGGVEAAAEQKEQAPPAPIDAAILGAFQLKPEEAKPSPEMEQVEDVGSIEAQLEEAMPEPEPFPLIEAMEELDSIEAQLESAMPGPEEPAVTPVPASLFGELKAEEERLPSLTEPAAEPEPGLPDLGSIELSLEPEPPLTPEVRVTKPTRGPEPMTYEPLPELTGPAEASLSDLSVPAVDDLPPQTLFISDAMNICEECGAFVPPDAAECEICGTSLGGEKVKVVQRAAPLLPDYEGPAERSLRKALQVYGELPEAAIHPEETDTILLCTSCGAFMQASDRQCPICDLAVDEMGERMPNYAEVLQEEEAPQPTMHLCQECGAFTRPGAAHCGVCGTDLPEGVISIEPGESMDLVDNELELGAAKLMDFLGVEDVARPIEADPLGGALFLCEECGAFMAEDALECPICGTPVDDAGEMEAEATAQTWEPSPAPMPVPAAETIHVPEQPIQVEEPEPILIEKPRPVPPPIAPAQTKPEPVGVDRPKVTRPVPARAPPPPRVVARPAVPTRSAVNAVAGLRDVAALSVAESEIDPEALEGKVHRSSIPVTRYATPGKTHIRCPVCQTLVDADSLSCPKCRTVFKDRVGVAAKARPGGRKAPASARQRQKVRIGDDDEVSVPIRTKAGKVVKGGRSIAPGALSAALLSKGWERTRVLILFLSTLVCLVIGAEYLAIRGSAGLLTSYAFSIFAIFGIFLMMGIGLIFLGIGQFPKGMLHESRLFLAGLLVLALVPIHWYIDFGLMGGTLIDLQNPYIDGILAIIGLSAAASGAMKMRDRHEQLLIWFVGVVMVFTYGFQQMVGFSGPVNSYTYPMFFLGLIGGLFILFAFGIWLKEWVQSRYGRRGVMVGNREYLSSNYQAALRAYDTAIKEMDGSQFDDVPWYSKGSALIKLGSYHEALRCLNEAIRINPYNEISWNGKGLALDKLGRHGEALRCFNEALRLNPRSEVTWNNKGNVMARMHNYPEAVRCYNMALTIQPRYKDAWINKGYVLVRMGYYEEAVKCANKASTAA